MGRGGEKREGGKKKKKIGCSNICKIKTATNVTLLLKMSGETYYRNDQTHRTDQVRKFKNVSAENNPILECDKIIVYLFPVQIV